MSNIGIGRNEILYVKKETPYGTIAYPSGSDAIRSVGDGSFSQEPILNENPERHDTPSMMPQLLGPFPAGEYNFDVMIKPSGAPGTAFRIDPLWEALYGIKTVNSGVSVVYTHSGGNDPIGVTVAHRQGHLVTWNVGCIVDKGSFPIKAGNEDDAWGRGKFSGQFLKQIKCGITNVNGALLALATSGMMDLAAVIDAGAKIKFGTEDNAGAGYLVTAVDIATNTVTWTPGLVNAVNDDTEVSGFLPTPADTGTAIHGRFGIAQEKIGAGAYANIIIDDASIDITNGFKVRDNEKTGDGYPATAVRDGRRKVEIKFTTLFLKSASQHWYQAVVKTLYGLKFPVGSTAGSRYRFEFPQAEIKVPAIGGGAGTLTLSRTGLAVASSAYNDESSLICD